jgi:hypothetical protein
MNGHCLDPFLAFATEDWIQINGAIAAIAGQIDKYAHRLTKFTSSQNRLFPFPSPAT